MTEKPFYMSATKIVFIALTGTICGALFVDNVNNDIFSLVKESYELIIAFYFGQKIGILSSKASKSQ